MQRKRGAGEERRVLGWREWVALPGLGIDAIKAKVDTGARTSCLHAYDVEEFKRGRREMVRFKVHPKQRDAQVVVVTEAPVCDRRKVKSSSGHLELRPVILTSVLVRDECFETELTLTRRDEMGFRMLLGRQTIRGRFLVDPGRSFVNGRRKKAARRGKKNKNRAR